MAISIKINSTTISEANLGKVVVVKQFDPFNTTIPASSLEATIQSSTAYSFSTNDKVIVYDGTNVVGVYYLINFQKTIRDEYILKAQDLIGKLKNERIILNFTSGLTGTQLLTSILGSGSTTFTDSKTYYGVFNDINKAEALRQYLEISGNVCSTDINDATHPIEIKNRPTNYIPSAYYTSVYDTNKIYTDLVFNDEQRIKQVNYYQTAYSPDVKGKVIINNQNYLMNQTGTSWLNADDQPSNDSEIENLKPNGIFGSTYAQYNLYKPSKSVRFSKVYESERIGDMKRLDMSASEKYNTIINYIEIEFKGNNKFSKIRAFIPLDSSEITDIWFNADDNDFGITNNQIRLASNVVASSSLFTNVPKATIIPLLNSTFGTQFDNSTTDYELATNYFLVHDNLYNLYLMKYDYEMGFTGQAGVYKYVRKLDNSFKDKQWIFGYGLTSDINLVNLVGTGASHDFNAYFEYASNSVSSQGNVGITETEIIVNDANGFRFGEYGEEKTSCQREDRITIEYSDQSDDIGMWFINRVDSNGNYYATARFQFYKDGTDKYDIQELYLEDILSKNGVKTINGNSIVGSGDITISGEPATYIKSASVSGSTLTLVNKDDTTIVYTSGEPASYIKNAQVVGDRLNLTKQDGSTISFEPVQVESKQNTNVDILRTAGFYGLKTCTNIPSPFTDGCLLVLRPYPVQTLSPYTNCQIFLPSGDSLSGDVNTMWYRTSTTSTWGAWQQVAKSSDIPTQFLKNASVSGNTLTITKQDGSTITFSGGEPASYIKDASVSGNTLTLTKKDGTTLTFSPTELFICTYGTTTHTQIQNAINNGNLPIVKSSGFIGIYYQTTGTAHYFNYVSKSGGAISSIRIACNTSNQWYTETDTLALSTDVPSQYIKNASVSGNTLTITKQDGSTITFSPSGSVSNPLMLTYQGVQYEVASSSGDTSLGNSQHMTYIKSASNKLFYVEEKNVIYSDGDLNFSHSSVVDLEGEDYQGLVFEDGTIKAYVKGEWKDLADIGQGGGGGNLFLHQLIVQGTGLRGNIMFINDNDTEINTLALLTALMQTIPNVQYLASGVYNNGSTGYVVRAIQWNNSANNLRLLLVDMNGNGSVVLPSNIVDFAVSDSVIPLSVGSGGQPTESHHLPKMDTCTINGTLNREGGEFGDPTQIYNKNYDSNLFIDFSKGDAEYDESESNGKIALRLDYLLSPRARHCKKERFGFRDQNFRSYDNQFFFRAVDYEFDASSNHSFTIPLHNVIYRLLVRGAEMSDITFTNEGEQIVKECISWLTDDTFMGVDYYGDRPYGSQQVHVKKSMRNSDPQSWGNYDPTNRRWWNQQFSSCTPYGFTSERSSRVLGFNNQPTTTGIIVLESRFEDQELWIPFNNDYMSSGGKVYANEFRIEPQPDFNNGSFSFAFHESLWTDNMGSRLMFKINMVEFDDDLDNIDFRTIQNHPYKKIGKCSSSYFVVNFFVLQYKNVTDQDDDIYYPVILYEVREVKDEK